MIRWRLQEDKTIRLAFRQAVQIEVS